MDRTYLQQIANYNYWADSKIIAWLQQITDQQWEQVITSSFSSIAQTAIHIVSAEKYWIDHWTHTPGPTFFSLEFKGTKNELIEIWTRSSAAFSSCVESYPAVNYSQAVSFKYPKSGGTGQMAFWQTVVHAINHSTYHRGQLVTLFRQVGFTHLSSLDMATYFQLQLSE
ncbi:MULTISPECIES: DinB family protein [Niastella]|uniref:DinB family protein n=1 Tax=Niastella soli TaxID=2821487 RepID=A0ABS3Z012_9BACT|nr:DinB family protein [Niastella soli]MBO9203505.1 DinB family protein [Niastella soli]